MTMPIDLVLVRHGESEGNVAVKAAERGDDSLFTPEFRNQHNSSWKLSAKGRTQAETAGEWIRHNMVDLLPFDRYYVSEYARALETAALLKIPDASWKVDFYLRERDYGALCSLPESERMERFSDAMRRRDIDSFFWAPPEGESMAQLCLRIDRMIDTLHRECEEKRVLIVCHGEVMWAFRVRLERMLQHRYRQLDTSKHPFDHIHNCQVIHYTRRGEPLPPEKRRGITTPGDAMLQGLIAKSKETKFYERMRSICPTNLTLSRNHWEPIVRKSYSNDELLEILRKNAGVI